MKILLTLSFTMLLCVTVFGQAPITIDASDVPLPASIVVFDDIFEENIGNPLPGENIPWDYSFYFGDSLLANEYPLETDPFFIAAGIDINTLVFKGLTSTLGYLYKAELDFNDYGVYESGLSIDAARFSLGSFTGNANDSLIIPTQKRLFPSAKTIMQFPYTFKSAWDSRSRRYADFILTVQAFGLDHVPGQHVFTTVRKDTIVGWGTMMVYTDHGPSVPYEVLMDKVEEYNIDSFYLNGSPASPFLLSAFGVSQGQHTNVSHFYRFNREGVGSYPFHANFAYGEDATYTMLTDARINRTNLVTGIRDLQNVLYSTIIFPNPSLNGQFDILISGPHPEINEYIITDLSGRTVQKGSVVNADLIHLEVNNAVLNGDYVVVLKDKSCKAIVSQKISLMK